MFSSRRGKQRFSNLARRRRKIFGIKLVAIGLGFLVVIGGISWLSHLDSVTIKQVSVLGTRTVPDSVVHDLVYSELEGTYPLLFSRSNIFIYPKNDITASVQEAFPNIGSIEFIFESLESISVSVRERSEDALWCNNKEECYFVDEDGLIFGKSPLFSDTVFIKFYTEVPQENPIGEYIFSSSEFKNISFFLDAVEKLGVVIVKFGVVDSTDFELTFNNGARVVFSRDGDLSQILANLEAVLNSETLENEKIDYIDLRFGNKVFYKFK